MSVCLSDGLSVCLSLCSFLRYRLNVFLPSLPEVGCPIFLKIRNPWGKEIKRSGLRFEHFCLEVVYNRQTKKMYFFCWFYLTNHSSRGIKDLWSKGVSLILAYFYTFLSFYNFDDFFRFSKKGRYLGYMVTWFHGGNHVSRWIRDLWSKGVSLIVAYF